MAAGHNLTSSVESQEIQLEYKLSEAYLMFKEFIECSNDGKVKWLSNLNDLKAFIFALFGDVGKWWSSPGGGAKSYWKDLISIDWYTHNKALTFHDRLGIVLKNKLIDLRVNKISDRDEYNQLNDPESDKDCMACSRFPLDMMEIKSDLKQMHTLMKNHYHESTPTKCCSTGHLCSANTCEMGVQTDIEFTQHPNQSRERCASMCNELSTEFEGLKLDMVISEFKIDNKIRINGDAINQVQAELANIKNQLGKVVQQVDRLVNSNENNNTNNNNIAESIVRTASENNSLINTAETLCKGLKTMIDLCNANFINHSDQPSVPPNSTLDQINISPSATELNQQQLHQILNPPAVCKSQDESCIESLITVDEASITTEALSLDNTQSNSYPYIISISDDQQAGSYSPNGNSTTIEEIVAGFDQNYNPSTMPPSFDDQLKEYRTKHSHADRRIVVHYNSGITHQKTARKATGNRKNTTSSQIKSKRRNYIPQPI
jgi:hypothetical protein